MKIVGTVIELQFETIERITSKYLFYNTCIQRPHFFQRIVPGAIARPICIDSALITNF